MNITTVGIDLAKNVFQVHGVDERGKVVLRKAVKRAELAKVFVKMPSCLIGLEACGSAHYWARKLAELGHTVKLMAPQFVKPYVKTNKNDARSDSWLMKLLARRNRKVAAVALANKNARIVWALLAHHREYCAGPIAAAA